MMRFADFIRSPFGAVLTVLVLATAATTPVSFGFTEDSIGGGVALVVSAVLCFIIVPLFLIRRVFRESPRDYFWRLPEYNSRTVALTIAVLALHVLVIFVFANRPEFREFYSLGSISSVGRILCLVAALAAYYLAEEFLFRGFLLGMLYKKSVLLAYTINIALFALLHFQKPALEVVFAAASAAVLCWLTLKTKSFLPAAFVHFSMAVILLILVTV